MTTSFYLTATESIGGTWYQLIIRDTHFCVSCGSNLERILEVLKSYVKQYRTKERLLRAMRDLDCGGKVSPATFEHREDYYKIHGKDFESLLTTIIGEAQKEAREEEKANSPLRKAKARLTKAGGVKTIETKPVEETTPPQTTKDSPKFLRKKPVVFKRK